MNEWDVFMSVTESDSETIDMFVKRIKTQANKCEFAGLQHAYQPYRKMSIYMHFRHYLLLHTHIFHIFSIYTLNLNNLLDILVWK